MSIRRTYLHPKLLARAGAALAAGTLVVGCGSGGGGSTTPSPSAAAPGPVVSSGGVQDAGGAGGAANNGPAAGTVSGGGNAGRISTAATGSYGHAAPSFGQAKAQYGRVPTGSVLTGSQVNRTPPPPATPAKPSTPPVRKSSRTGTAGTIQPAPSPPATRTRTVVRYLTRLRFRTVYRDHTITKTVTKTQNPNVPAGAFLPSRHPVLAQRSFTVTGGNVGCQLAADAVRCALTRRVWAAPVPPATCRSSWGDTVGLAGKTPAQFACGGSDPIDPAAKVIPSGYDTTVGDITCQVRSFGVDCFNVKTRNGFLLSRTGYTLY